MLHEFLDLHRADLIARCRAKVALRLRPVALLSHDHGIPAFLEGLIDTLRAEHAAVPSRIAHDAALHGRESLRFGYTVEQVVHDYGDLCQAVAELAIEKRATITGDEFKALNRCLDHAIAGAVAEYDRQRDEMVADAGNRATNERLGFLAHELRNFLNTAVLAFAALKSGSVGVNGPTSRVIDRSLVGLRDLIDRQLADVRFASRLLSHPEDIGLDGFIAEVQTSAMLAANARGCVLRVQPVAPGLVVEMDRQMLHAAVENLLQNAFKFTHPGSQVVLRTGSTRERVTIEVQDECGGLPAGKASSLFESFEQHHADRSGLGLGLSISRRAVEAGQGTLSVRDLPGVGCVFTIDLPRRPPVELQAGL